MSTKAMKYNPVAPSSTVLNLYSNGWTLVNQKWRVPAPQTGLVPHMLKNVFPSVDTDTIEVTTSPAQSCGYCSLKGDNGEGSGSSVEELSKMLGWYVSIDLVNNQGERYEMVHGHIKGIGNGYLILDRTNGEVFNVPVRCLEKGRMLLSSENVPVGPYFSIGVTAAPAQRKGELNGFGTTDVSISYLTQAFSYAFVHNIEIQGYGDTKAKWSLSAHVKSSNKYVPPEVTAWFSDQAYVSAKTVSQQPQPHQQQQVYYQERSFAKGQSSKVVMASKSFKPSVAVPEDGEEEDESQEISQSKGPNGKSAGTYGTSYDAPNCGAVFAVGGGVVPLLNGSSQEIGCSYVTRWSHEDIKRKYSRFSEGNKNPLRLLRLNEGLDRLVDGSANVWLREASQSTSSGSSDKVYQSKQQGVATIRSKDRKYAVVELLLGIEESLEVSLKNHGHMKDVEYNAESQPSTGHVRPVNQGRFITSYTLCVKRRLMDTVPLVLEVWDMAPSEDWEVIAKDSKLTISSPPISSSHTKRDPSLLQVSLMVPSGGAKGEYEFNYKVAYYKKIEE